MQRKSPSTPMITRKTAGYGSIGAILVAWLAAANLPSPNIEITRSRDPRAGAAAPVDGIASEVRSQAAKLRGRLAQAPAPDLNPRNPFAFVAAPRRSHPEAPVVRAAVAAEESTPLAPAPPALILMGIAEDTSPAGPRRTAIIAGEADALFMVTEGQLVAGRYKVSKIGADAVELEEIGTKGYRRLALR